MNKLSVYVKVALSYVLIWAFYAGLITVIPALRNVDVSVHGWGWAVLLLGSLAGAVVGTVLGLFVNHLFEDSQTPNAQTISTLIRGALIYSGMAATILFIGSFFPNLFVNTAAGPIIAMAALFGLAWRAMDVVTNRFLSRRN